MAHHKSAIKAIRSSRAARARNRHHSSTLKTAIKHFREELGGGDAAKATADLPKIMKEIDQFAAKGLFSRRTASRRISRLAKAVNKLNAAKTQSK